MKTFATERIFTIYFISEFIRFFDAFLVPARKADGQLRLTMQGPHLLFALQIGLCAQLIDDFSFNPLLVKFVLVLISEINSFAAEC